MDTTFAPAPTPVTHAATGPRPDLYGPIHKAWRLFLADTMVQVGRLDVDDDVEREQVCDQVLALMQQMRQHLHHENHFVHTAIEARRPGATRPTVEDHTAHLDAIGNLEDEAVALRHAGSDRPGQRALLVQRLYRHLALFAAHNFEHMQHEEIDNNGLLWALYSDAELLALEGRLLASIEPIELARTARWLARSLSPQELAGMYADLRAKAPPAAFDALYGIAMAELDAGRAAKLARALGLPPVPGLVTA